MSTLTSYYKEERPWGSFERFVTGEPVTVKILSVSPGKRFSLQKHSRRDEFWRVIEGAGTVQLDKEELSVEKGDEVFIPIGTLHRLTGGEGGIKVLEITFGEFDEADIERFEDDFGRA